MRRRPSALTRPAFLASLAALLLAPALSAQTPRRPRRYTIEQFMNTVTMNGASYAPDGRSIIFSSNRSGVFNVWEVPVAGGEARQITTSTTDAIFGADFVPGSRRIVYLSNHGGNENDHLFLREPDGTVRDLTPGDSSKAAPLGWSADDRGLFYGWNGRDPRFFDVYEIGMTDWIPRLLFRDTVGYDVGAISPDRRYLALSKSITTSNNEMYLRDARTGEIRHISQHQGNVTSTPMEFSHDGRWLYYVTDEGSEFAYLKRYEVASGRTEDVERADWDVSFAYFSKRGTYLVIGINNDARTEIRIYEAATHHRVALPAMPAGEIRGVTFSPNEQQMALYVNGDRSPSNLYVYDFPTRRTRQLTESLNPDIAAADLVEAQVIRYASWDGLQIPSLLYRPLEANAATRMPVVLWIHGGPGGQTRTGYSAGIQFLVNHGYAVLGINNRGSSGYGKTFFAADDRRHGEADLDDVVWSKRWLAGLGWVDTARTVIMGGSYGGYMTLAGMTFRPTEFAAGVDMFGISNWIRTLESIPPWWESFRQALYAELGDPATDSVRLRRISPLFHADQIQRPIMVLQGANDPRVLMVESDEMGAAVWRRGGVAEYVVFDNEGHGFVQKENNIRAWRSILEFLDRYVGAPAVP